MAAISTGNYLFTKERILPDTEIPSIEEVDPGSECYITIGFFDATAGEKLTDVTTSDRISKLFLCINVLENSGAEGLCQSLSNVKAWTHISVNKIDHQFSEGLLRALRENTNLKSLGHEISVNNEYNVSFASIPSKT